jgi:hypothetical protein
MKRYTLIHKDTNQTLGHLEVSNDDRIVFRLADSIDAATWNAVGFLPVDLQSRILDDQRVIYYSLYSRVPLKQRMKKDESSRRETLKFLRHNPLNVITDSLSFVTCK